MKRSHLLAALALAAVTGCRVENGSSIEITGNALPSDEKKCVFTAGGVNDLSSGQYDPLVGGPFNLAVYVQNNLVDPNTIAPGSTTDSKGWRPEHVRIRLNPKDYTGQYNPSPALAAVSAADLTLPVVPSSTVEPSGGRATVYMNIVSDGLVAALQGIVGEQTVVLGITLEGHTNDGARLDSNEWPFPVDIKPGKFTNVVDLTCTLPLVATGPCTGQRDAGSCQ